MEKDVVFVLSIAIDGRRKRIHDRGGRSVYARGIDPEAALALAGRRGGRRRSRSIERHMRSPQLAHAAVGARGARCSPRTPAASTRERRDEPLTRTHAGLFLCHLAADAREEASCSTTLTVGADTGRCGHDVRPRRRRATAAGGAATWSRNVRP